MNRKILLILFVLLNLTSLSQDNPFKSAKEKNENKPTLFHESPDSVNVNSALFQKIETLNLNDEVNLLILDNFNFKGKVKILHETTDYRSLMIESEEKPGLRFIISHTNQNEYYAIIGCVDHKDVFVLRKIKADKYIWVKRQMADLIPD